MIDPALQSLAVPVASLNPDPANTRRHDQRNIDVIKASLLRFGQRKPIVVQKKGMIVRAGNGTLQAAKELRWTEIAAVVLDDDDITATAFSITDNRSAELATWHEPDLTRLLKELEKDIDVNELGFDTAEMTALLDKFDDHSGQTDDDAVPDVPDDCDIKRGDLFTLGDHRLLCGDSTLEADFAKLMNGEKADMILCDPPYALFGNSTGISNVCDDKMVRPFFSIIAKLTANHSKALIHSYVCCDWHSWNVLFDEFQKNLWVTKNIIVWDKKSGGLGQAYRMQHELLLFSIRGENNQKYITGKCNNKRQITDVNLWSIAREFKKEHGAQKPVELFERAILNSCDAQDVVLDPFLGSGSTLIACEKLQRRCFGMEISPHYCQVIITRWEDFTGKKAVKLT